jgi:hypothetical protein
MTDKQIIHEYLRAYCDRIEPYTLTLDDVLIYFFEPRGNDAQTAFSIREDQGIFIGVREWDSIGEDHELLDFKAVQEFVHNNYIRGTML